MHPLLMSNFRDVCLAPSAPVTLTAPFAFEYMALNMPMLLSDAPASRSASSIRAWLTLVKASLTSMKVIVRDFSSSIAKFIKVLNVYELSLVDPALAESGLCIR